MTVSLDGFRTQTQSITIVAGEDSWASFGLAPIENADELAELSFSVFDASIGPTALLEGVRIAIKPTGRNDLEQVFFTDASGQRDLSVEPGDWTLTASLAGYTEVSEAFFFEGQAYEVELGMSKAVGNEGDARSVELDNNTDGLQYEDYLRIAESGCGQMAESNAMQLAGLLAIFVLGFPRTKRKRKA